MTDSSRKASEPQGPRRATRTVRKKVRKKVRVRKGSRKRRHFARSTMEIRQTYPRHRMPWTPEDLGLLRRLVMDFIPWEFVSDQLGRTVGTVQSRASSMGWLRERSGCQRWSDLQRG